jgi:hypothetical protein
LANRFRFECEAICPWRDGRHEQCVDEIDDFIETLDHHPGSVIAMALRIHLAALLRAMVDDRLCSPDEVREFLAELEQEAIGAEGP